MRDPFKLPNEPNPTQQQANCPRCKGLLENPNTTECPNCHYVFTKPIVGDPYKHVAPVPKPKSNDGFNVPLSSRNIKVVEAKKKEKHRVKDDFTSDEFKQCVEKPNHIKRKKNQFDDNKLRDVWKSCTDLEIDG